MKNDLNNLTDAQLYQELMDGSGENKGAVIAEKKRREKIENDELEKKRIKIASAANRIAIFSALLSAIATVISLAALYFSQIKT